MGMELMHNKAKLFVFLLILLSQVSIWAKEVDIKPSISVGVGYSDNIRLEEKNEKSSAYTRITPGIKFKREGARVKADVNYSITGLFYASENDLNEVQHRLFANANSELVKNSIFMDLDASITQELLNNRYSASSDGVSGSQNLTQTYSYGVSPYWKKKWSNFAQSTLKYTYDEVIYDSSTNRGGNDSTRNNFSLNIESGPKFRRYFWNFNYQYNDISYDQRQNIVDPVYTGTVRDTTSEAYKVVLGYHYSKQLDFTYTTGYEDYDDGRSDGGTGWRLGLNWNPTTKTSLIAEAGRRFFGKTLLMKFRHRSKKLIWNFNYNDSITDTRGQIVNNARAQSTNPGSITTPLSSSFSAQYYLSRRFTGDVSYKRKKSTFKVGIFDERRYYYDSDKNDEEDIGINFNWGLKVGKRTNMDTRFLFSKIENKTGVNNGNGQKNTQDRTELIWSLSHRLSPEMTGSLSVSYRDNSADIKTYEYTEHTIFMNVVKRF